MLEMRPVAARGVVMATATLVLLLLLPMTGATADKIPLGESAITCLIAYYIHAVGRRIHMHMQLLDRAFVPAFFTVSTRVTLFLTFY